MIRGESAYAMYNQENATEIFDDGRLGGFVTLPPSRFPTSMAPAYKENAAETPIGDRLFGFIWEAT